MAQLPPQFVAPSDSADAPAESRLCVAEDGRPLGPRHSQHEAIAREGGGRYSHWNGGLLFSTSDGSDPNTNGRRYRAYPVAGTPRLLAFGSCHVHGAVDILERRGLAYSVRRTPTQTLTPRETLRLIEFEFGRLQIPEALQPWAVPQDGQTVLPAAASATDLVFLEFSQAIDVVCHSVGIMRNAVVNRIVLPVAALGKAESRAVTQWYRHGLIQCNEILRSEAAEQLLALLPRIDTDQAAARDIVMNARGSMQSEEEVAGTISQIRDTLRAKNVNVISAPNMYMPDGRPVAFPVNFRKQLERVCGDLGVPVLRLADLVAAHGGKFALEDDLYHFTPQFMEHLADEVLAMSRRMLGSA